MENEVFLRIASFVGILSFIALWEIVAPRRPLTTRKGPRWFANLSMIAIATLLIRFTFPLLPVGLAIIAREQGWGVLNLISLPSWLAVTIALLALDLVIYLQHVMFHFLPTLWRLHRMHHSDLDLDASSGNRFHPVEIMISIGIKLGAVLIIGPSPFAVLLFEILLNAAAIFNHGNIRIPLGIDRWLRSVVVTPDMHRVHHSILPRETNSNFGFSLSWWDFLFGTYRAQPGAGHLEMTIGLKEYRNPARLTLPRLLVQPFITPPPPPPPRPSLTKEGSF
ncbi:MAG: fatty acid hydroxylase [Deltaproteobacteria bacterium HGW-Deltaproteobacteria-4]|nr:MAG: fatty acid hydroxylase [Deltaproteobacteria bacterium HGW-Deltaproteobacteria-4]